MWILGWIQLNPYQSSCSVNSHAFCFSCKVLLGISEVCLLLWLLASHCTMQVFHLKNLSNPPEPGDLSVFLREDAVAWDLLWQLEKVFDGASNLLLWTHLWQLWPRCESHLAFRRIWKNDVSWLKTPGKYGHLEAGEPSSSRSTRSWRHTMGWEGIWENPDVTASPGRNVQSFIYSYILSTCSQWARTQYEPGTVKFKV